MSTDPDIDWTHETDPVVQEQRRQAGYADLFRSPLGQVVLADILRGAGIGLPLGSPNGIPGHRDYEAGRQDNALEIARLAAAPQAMIVKQVIQDQKGYYDERTEF